MSNWIEITRSYSVWDDQNIKGFFGQYRWLSNFHESEVPFDGLVFPTSEHAYQCAKTKHDSIRKLFAIHADPILTAREAKNKGQTIPMKSNWEEIKYNTMFVIVFNKFTNCAMLRGWLKATGNKYLEETNHWNDTYWGIDFRTGEGENNLGKILMDVRAMI